MKFNQLKTSYKKQMSNTVQDSQKSAGPETQAPILKPSLPAKGKFHIF